MIEVNNLSVYIGNKSILKNINFSLRKGILSIIGLNGIGKTTLLRTLAGLNKDYSGNISINQKLLSSFSHKSLAKSISFVPQEHVPYFNFTVLEMIMFGRTPHIKQFGFPTKNDFNVVEKIICDIGLEHLKERYYTELSGGEKRLVLVAMSLAQETQIILFDEPTTFLDFKNEMIILNEIKKLSKELGKLIVVTIHDINQAISIADQALILYSEESYDVGNADVTINESNLQRLYGMEFKTIYDDKSKFIVPRRI
jgi:iron complex transport system ATP-binding protein